MMKPTRQLLLLFVAVGFLTLVQLSCKSGGQKILIETDMGNITVELYDSTPLHRDNMIKLAKEGFYDDLLFHRVIKGFMVQGGDPNSRGAAAGMPLGSGGPGYLIDNEIGAPHFKGTLAAARTGGASNPTKQSSGSQFYLVQGSVQSDASLDQFEKRGGFTYNAAQREKYKTIGGAPALDNDYTVFGEVVSGMEIIDKIAMTPTAPGDRPITDIKMKISLAN